MPHQEAGDASFQYMFLSTFLPGVGWGTKLHITRCCALSLVVGERLGDTREGVKDEARSKGEGPGEGL